MDGVAAIDEVFAFPRRRAENFLRMDESGGGLGSDVGGGGVVVRVGVLERDFPRERTMMIDESMKGEQTNKRQTPLTRPSVRIKY